MWILKLKGLATSLRHSTYATNF